MKVHGDGNRGFCTWHRMMLPLSIVYTPLQYQPYPRTMPHSPEEKKRAITRLRRIRGQAEALERVISEGATCSAVLQQLAAMRGAVNGLMSDVIEGHLYETFGHADCDEAACSDASHAKIHTTIDETVSIVKSYLK